MAKKGNNSVEGISLKEEVDGFSCGYGLIDLVSGVPGMLFPRATIVELYGNKSSSKTTLVLETIAFNQMINPDFKVLYADFERMLRKQAKYLLQLGVDIRDENKFVIITPNTMEEGCAEIIKLVQEEQFDMVVVDTVAAMRPKVELEKGFAENKQMGVKGKLMSEFLRNLMADLPDDGPAIVFINQQYKDINNSSFIQMYVTPSSDALAFYAGIRLEVKETGKVKKSVVNPYTLEEVDTPYGSTISIKSQKNKVGKPFIESKYFINYGYGINIIPSVINAAVNAKVITTKGQSKSAYLLNLSDGSEKTINGLSKLIDFFTENIDEFVFIGSKINDLWAKDLSKYKERVLRKRAYQSDSFFSMYTTDDEEEGDSVETLGDEEAPSLSDEDAESLSDLDEKPIETVISKGKPVKPAGPFKMTFGG